MCSQQLPVLVMCLLQTLLGMTLLGVSAGTVTLQRFDDLPFDVNDRLVGNWMVYKEADLTSSSNNLCQDSVFLDPSNWLHRDEVADLFSFAYLTDNDMKSVLQNELGMRLNNTHPEVGSMRYRLCVIFFQKMLLMVVMVVVVVLLAKVQVLLMMLLTVLTQSALLCACSLALQGTSSTIPSPLISSALLLTAL